MLQSTRRSYRENWVNVDTFHLQHTDQDRALVLLVLSHSLNVQFDR